jgi:hypothetical protein
VDLAERLNAFLEEQDEEDETSASDTLTELVRIHKALSRLYASLSARPRRSPTATGLLDELWSEYERLLRRAGEEALHRALRQPAVALSPGAVSGQPAPSPLLDAPSPVSEQDVRQWAARYRERPAPAQVSPAVVLHALLDRVGPPPDELGGDTRDQEVDRLEQGTSEDTLREVRLLPNDAQRAYLRLLTARLNAVRALVGADVLMRERVGRLLGIIRDYTREHRPGAVFGLSRDHEPKSGTWEGDAHYLWHRLVRDDDDAPVSRSTPIHHGSRRGVEAESEDADERESQGPEQDWALWPFVRERTALMIGGAPRESARVRIEHTFALRELVWSADDPRKAQSAEARILSGGYDLVLVLLRFMSHATNEKLLHACGSRDVPYVPIEHGYGVASIRRSLERFLTPRAAADVASK